MKTLYFDCFSGVSGNMILGGLVSLGVDPSALKSEISKLNIAKFELEFTRVDRSGINSVHVRTRYEEEIKHRHLSDIDEILNKSDLDESVRIKSIEIFTNLAQAEAKVHGIPVEQVHFHEVGAMDAIIDVVGACVGFSILGVENFVCSKLHVGSGFVDIAHGRYPVPPPAVAELLTGFPYYSTTIEGELVTPTGAAVVTTVCNRFEELSEFRPLKTGYGAGTREYDKFPNVLRMILGESQAKSELVETLCLLETNVDDCTGERLGYVMERAFELGALDCWFTPIQMKKNRPASLVSILCNEDEKELLKQLLYTETSTIGIRARSVERHCLEREVETLSTRFGEVQLKVAKYAGRVVNIKPEFDQVADLAKKAGVEFKLVELEISGICSEKYKGARIDGPKAFGRSG